MAQIYNSNSNLKAAGVTVDFTPDNIQEYIKCAADPIYFIENYCYIVTLDFGLKLFKLYDCQKKKVEIIHSNRRVILMEGRQQGKTTTSAAYILWYTLFQANKTVAILANKATAAREVLDRYQTMYELLPRWMQQGVTGWNKGDIELENGSKVFTAATTASGIRGKSVNMLYVDEAAIIPNNVAEQFFTSVYPTISAGQTTKILMSSTPLGYNHFWKYWTDAEKGRNGFVPLFIPYWEIPGRDEAWAAEQKAQLGELKYTQEVLCNFLGSSLTLIKADVIARMSPDNIIHSKDGLDIYEKPSAGHTYCMVCDVAKGVGGDYSSFQIIDITETPYRVVGKYRDNQISPILYPSVIYKIGKEYNNAYVLLEINISEQVAHILYSEMEYENILFVTRHTMGQTVSGGFGGGKTQLGVVTDKKIKRIGCHNFKALVEENKLIINDADTISEISTFIEKKGSYEADEGYHDDLVMPLVLFSWLTTNSYFKDLNNVNLREIMYKKQMQAIEEELTPFGFYDDGSPERAPLNF
ncbi:large terminase protein [uncultured Caudovirales phage]|uniref:Large terminase protein n=1 Tax=uncultured Caudovirales phage TaxID=2100421 RepID=A0A6J7WTT7_9CAUD|nr:large terminase protein [uncultured Caudovirales phage]